MLNADGKVDNFVKNTRFTIFLSPVEGSLKIFRTVAWEIENSRTEEGISVLNGDYLCWKKEGKPIRHYLT